MKLLKSQQLTKRKVVHNAYGTEQIQLGRVRRSCEIVYQDRNGNEHIYAFSAVHHFDTGGIIYKIDVHVPEFGNILKMANILQKLWFTEYPARNAKSVSEAEFFSLKKEVQEMKSTIEELTQQVANLQQTPPASPSTLNFLNSPEF